MKSVWKCGGCGRDEAVTAGRLLWRGSVLALFSSSSGGKSTRGFTGLSIIIRQWFLASARMIVYSPRLQ